MSYLRRCLLQCHGLDFQVAECTIHLGSAWISWDQALSSPSWEPNFLCSLEPRARLVQTALFLLPRA